MIKVGYYLLISCNLFVFAIARAINTQLPGLATGRKNSYLKFIFGYILL